MLHRLLFCWLALSTQGLAAQAPSAPSAPVLAKDVLSRYDLPSGQNLAHVVLDETARTMGIPLDSKVPLAMRLFGSSVYLVDGKSNRLDWPLVHDVDGVIYIDHPAHEENPGQTLGGPEDPATDWARQRWLVKRNVEARLKNMAAQLGPGFEALGRAEFRVLPGGFEDLRSGDGLVMEGYHPDEPHFGNATGLERIRAVTSDMPATTLREELRMRYASVQSYIEYSRSIQPPGAKEVKRLLQLAIWRGDDAAAARLKDSLKKLLKSRPNWIERVFQKRRLRKLVESALESWPATAGALPNRLSDTITHAENNGETLVPISKRSEQSPKD